MRSQFVTAYSTYGAYRNGGCSTELTAYPRNPRSPPKNCWHSLAARDAADKVAFLWLNTELRGCLETELGMT